MRAPFRVCLPWRGRGAAEPLKRNEPASPTTHGAMRAPARFAARWIRLSRSELVPQRRAVCVRGGPVPASCGCAHARQGRMDTESERRVQSRGGRTWRRSDGAVECGSGDYCDRGRPVGGNRGAPPQSALWTLFLPPSSLHRLRRRATVIVTSRRRRRHRRIVHTPLALIVRPRDRPTVVARYRLCRYREGGAGRWAFLEIGVST